MHSISRARRLRVGALTALASACAAACLPVLAADDDAASRAHSLGIVRVDGAAPTSLPSRIPTTMEGVSGEAIARDINATDAEDALKYLPSLLVRKRYIGDYNHAVLSTRASGTGNSARSLVYADGILLSNLLGNGATFAPRWGLVSPEEIARVDVMYGPFSAAYSGNAVGAVVDYQTRMPTRFEAHARVGYSHQPNDLYGRRRNYDAKQASASIGSAEGAFSWWIHAGRTDSEGQPQTFANRSPASAPAPAGTVPVTGAVPGLNRNNQPWLLIGSGTQYDTVQDQAKVKLAYDLDPGLRALYVFGLWSNRSDGRSRSFLSDAAGRPIDNRSGGGITQPVAIDGKLYTLAGSDFPQTRDELEHRMHALSLKRRVREGLGWELSGSVYDYLADRSRAYAPTAKATDGGRLTDQSGTGWHTLSAKLTWTPEGSDHAIDAGVSQERYQLRNRVFGLSDWRSGAAGAQTSRFEGDTRVRAVFAQDAWTFAPDWTAVLGLRGERWQAFDGVTQTASDATPYPHADRAKTAWSPKAALSYGVGEHWVLKASTGRAVRFPTVSELFQGGFDTAGNFINNNPSLKPERSWTSELSAEWTGAGRDNLRVTLFHEDSRDALYSQINPGVSTSTSTVQNIDHVRTRGVELSGTASLPRRITLTGSVTFADSVILANSGYATVPGDTVGKWQPRVPRWRATLLAQWQARDDLSLSLGARYSGKQFGTLDNSDVNGLAYMASSKYFTVDARAQWRVDRQWTLAAGIDNLNDYQYWNFHPYPGRTFQVEARWDY
ncbi:TonB-dependent receptor [Mitsuaria sp. GD03876]|uniref:TonB-dependent receptor n=1 Tax=Mitsuaria sp. GD03876 TaxID=2975399 RepID=UPI00244AEEE9|nr:TonB-dependent receptor [Mitsuaria sp. GD03876]MDH0864607.1 TonB-dependent receptor [Mitsuaria sp. GD03876]